MSLIWPRLPAVAAGVDYPHQGIHVGKRAQRHG